MPIYTVRLTTPIQPTFRTHQVAGLFDLALDDLAGERFAHTLTAELPGLDEDWTIGAIVGPSGSGKTTLARAAYGAALYEPQPWPDDVAIIDALELRSAGCGVRSNGQLPSLTPHSEFRTPHLKHLLRVLTAVGLASPPSWLKPYRVLSTGERFRADLARAVLGAGVQGPTFKVQSCQRESTWNIEPGTLNSSGVIVFDEFTSTLDRTIACTASCALAKYLRSASPTPHSAIPNLKFIALSCHTDFLPWLAPDWILDLGERRPLTPSGPGDRQRAAEGATRRGGERENARGASPPLAPSPTLPLLPTWPRGSREQPQIRLAVRRVPQRFWPGFAKHHYLTGGLSTAATCYGAFAEIKALTSGQGDALSDIEAQRSADDAHVPARNTPTTGRGFGSPIAFCAVLATLGHRRAKHITRLVVLPEFQGLGIGPRLAESVAAMESAKGNRVTITASHPSVVAWCSRSPRWKYLGLKKTGSTRQTLGQRTIRTSAGRAVASFEWLGVSGE